MQSVVDNTTGSKSAATRELTARSVGVLGASATGARASLGGSVSEHFHIIVMRFTVYAVVPNS